MCPRRNRRRLMNTRQEILPVIREFVRRRERRSEILHRYASKDANQSPRLCRPTAEEYAAGDWLADRNLGKVIYRREDVAARAAEELERLGGTRTLEPYPCPRLDDGREHFHLRTRRRPAPGPC